MNPTTLESSSSKGVVDKINLEFNNLLERQAKLEKEKNYLADRLKQAEAENRAIDPKKLAKFHEEGKQSIEKELALDSKKAKLKEAAAKAKFEADKAAQEFQACEEEYKNLLNSSSSTFALLYAKVDAYCDSLKDKVKTELNQAKSERVKAENERQTANDLLNKAQAQLAKIENNGKTTLEKVKKAEDEMAVKIKAGEEYLKKQTAEKARLEKELQYLAEIQEKREKLEKGLK